MIYDKSIVFFGKTDGFEHELMCIGIDDLGFIMQPPLGEGLNATLGSILIDPEGTGYKIKSISLKQNLLWLSYLEK